MINLLPFSFSCPVQDVIASKICVYFTLFENKDKEILQDCAKIIGAQFELKEGLTTHVVVNDDNIKFLNKS